MSKKYIKVRTLRISLHEIVVFDKREISFEDHIKNKLINKGFNLKGSISRYVDECSRDMIYVQNYIFEPKKNRMKINVKRN